MYLIRNSSRDKVTDTMITGHHVHLGAPILVLQFGYTRHYQQRHIMDTFVLLYEGVFNLAALQLFSVSSL